MWVGVGLCGVPRGFLGVLFAFFCAGQKKMTPSQLSNEIGGKKGEKNADQAARPEDAEIDRNKGRPRAAAET
jgi:hypothetical protein